MERNELLQAMGRLKVETGSLACLGCGYEHNCGTRGCAIIRAAVEALTQPNEPEHREYICPDCGHIWLEDKDASDYPEHCPGRVVITLERRKVLPPNT